MHQPQDTRHKTYSLHAFAVVQTAMHSVEVDLVRYVGKQMK